VGSRGGLQSSTLISQCTPAEQRMPSGADTGHTPAPPCRVSPGPTGSQDWEHTGGTVQVQASCWDTPCGPLPWLALQLPLAPQGKMGFLTDSRTPLASHWVTCLLFPLWTQRSGGGLTLCTPGAGALVGVCEIDAGASILAGVGQALVDLLRAVGPMVACHALCRETEHRAG
jgi:hypothetical protein